MLAWQQSWTRTFAMKNILYLFTLKWHSSCPLVWICSSAASPVCRLPLQDENVKVEAGLDARALKKQSKHDHDKASMAMTKQAWP